MQTQKECSQLVKLDAWCPLLGFSNEWANMKYSPTKPFRAWFTNLQHHIFRDWSATKTERNWRALNQAIIRAENELCQARMRVLSCPVDWPRYGRQLININAGQIIGLIVTLLLLPSLPSDRSIVVGQNNRVGDHGLTFR